MARTTTVPDTKQSEIAEATASVERAILMVNKALENASLINRYVKDLEQENAALKARIQADNQHT